MITINAITNEVTLCCPTFLDAVVRGVFVIDNMGVKFPSVAIQFTQDWLLHYCPFCGKPFNPETHGHCPTSA